VVDLPFGIDINNLIDDLRTFSWEASDILLFYSDLLKNSGKDTTIIKNKSHEDPLTLADLKVNELIIKRLNSHYTNIDWKILSEESVKFDSEKSQTNSNWLWVLDPLDGTKDFIQGSGNYAMHLALNYKNKPYLGVVLIPEKNELWISNGKKVWSEKRGGSKKEICLSKCENLQDMTLVTSKNHGNEILEKLIKKINFKNVIVMGSIGCKIASIIRGESDIYISLSLKGKSSPKDWDFAAPAAILKSAGGSITNLENEDLVFNKPNFEQRGIIVASRNKENHANICVQLKKIIEANDFYPFFS